MQHHVLDTTGTAYTSNKIEEQKKAKKNKNKGDKPEGKQKKEKTEKKLSCPPRGGDVAGACKYRAEEK